MGLGEAACIWEARSRRYFVDWKSTLNVRMVLKLPSQPVYCYKNDALLVCRQSQVLDKEGRVEVRVVEKL